MHNNDVDDGDDGDDDGDDDDLVKINPLKLLGDEGVVEPLQFIRRHIQPPAVMFIIKIRTFRCTKKYHPHHLSSVCAASRPLMSVNLLASSL